MEELISLIREKGEGNPLLIKNLLLFLKNNYGILRKFPLTTKNYKFKYIGELVARDTIFYNDIAQYKDKYSPDMLRRFYTYWSEMNQLGNKMKWEMEKTWETGKRLATWYSNQIKRGY